MLYKRIFERTTPAADEPSMEVHVTREQLRALLANNEKSIKWGIFSSAFITMLSSASLAGVVIRGGISTSWHVLGTQEGITMFVSAFVAICSLGATVACSVDLQNQRSDAANAADALLST